MDIPYILQQVILSLVWNYFTQSRKEKEKKEQEKYKSSFV